MGAGGGERRNHPPVLEGTGLSTLKHGPSSSKKELSGGANRRASRTERRAGAVQHSRPGHRVKSNGISLTEPIFSSTFTKCTKSSR